MPLISESLSCGRFPQSSSGKPFRGCERPVPTVPFSVRHISLQKANGQLRRQRHWKTAICPHSLHWCGSPALLLRNCCKICFPARSPQNRRFRWASGTANSFSVKRVLCGYTGAALPELFRHLCRYIWRKITAKKWINCSGRAAARSSRSGTLAACSLHEDLLRNGGVYRMKQVQISEFEPTSSGQMAHFYRIENASGASVTLCDYGASIVSLLVPDRQKLPRDVVLGYAHVKGYETGGEYFGETVGRCCNRICHGRFVLNGQEIQLNCNDGKHHLHGGYRSLSRRIWQAECGGNSVAFTTESPDGEEHYPGNLQVTVTYTFDNTNTLTIAYEAVCDKDTICNLTNHSYFNLDGHQSGTLAHHMLKLFADSYIPIDQTSIPSGEIAPVAGTPFDFRAYKPIPAAFQEDCVQIQNAAGLDHSFAVRSDSPIQAEAYSTESGIRLTCKTTQPAIHVYTANFVETPADLGKDGCAYGKRGAFCLETQNFPDAINHPNFPSPILRANTPYRQETQFHFSLKGEA